MRDTMTDLRIFSGVSQINTRKVAMIDELKVAPWLLMHHAR
jgi:hypothetical protein